jgi:hypothetical protein
VLPDSKLCGGLSHCSGVTGGDDKRHRRKKSKEAGANTTPETPPDDVDVFDLINGLAEGGDKASATSQLGIVTDVTTLTSKSVVTIRRLYGATGDVLSCVPFRQANEQLMNVSDTISQLRGQLSTLQSSIARHSSEFPHSIVGVCEKALPMCR